MSQLLVCQHCTIQFIPKRTNYKNPQKFCSRECNFKAIRIICNCKQCSKPCKSKFCSRSCSATFNNKLKKVSDETKLKLSKYAKANPRGWHKKHYEGTLIRNTSGLRTNIKRKKKELKSSYCVGCATEFIDRKYTNKKYCTNECWRRHSGGMREGSTKIHRSFYKGIKMDSGAERLFAILLDANNIAWIKNIHTFFIYDYNNKGRPKKYYPDFYLPEFNIWVEIKGKLYVRSDDDKRLASVPNIVLVMSHELKNFSAVLSKIGGNIENRTRISG